MNADWNIARSDDEADRADEARAEWIAQRANDLKLEYATDSKKVGEAVADFFLADEDTLVPNLTQFYLDQPSRAQAGFTLHDQLREAIAPILWEYAEDEAAKEWDWLERNAMDMAADRREAA